MRPVLSVREIRAAAGEVEALRKLAFAQRALGAAAALAAGVASAVDARLALALWAGAGVEALLAVATAGQRRLLVASLALEPEAYAIGEVYRYGRKLTGAATRRTFARSIAEMLRAAGAEGAGVYLSDRVIAQAPALTGLGRALVQPGSRVEPTAMAALEQLLTDGRLSPLLNPALAPDELDAALRRIHRGIHPPREELRPPAGRPQTHP